MCFEIITENTKEELMNVLKAIIEKLTTGIKNNISLDGSSAGKHPMAVLIYVKK
jgi:hypothetical protein